jgi:hypothetical protein
VALLNKENLSSRVKAYLDKPKHSKVEGVTGPGAEGESEVDSEADKGDPWSEVHRHLDRLNASIEEQYK